MSDPRTVMSVVGGVAIVVIIVTVVDWVLNAIGNEYSITGIGTPMTFLRLFS